MRISTFSDTRTLKLAAITSLLAIGSVLVAAPQNDRRLPTPGQPATAPERRLALLVGNDNYKGAPLRNAVADARAVAKAFDELGFQVTKLEDSPRSEFVGRLAAFADGLTKNDVAVFYFAGHGLQIDGENFLVPADFQGSSPIDVKLDAIRASEVQKFLERARVAILILDACRNNPFAGTRAGGGGLASMEGRGSLIAFAAGAGQTAADGGRSGNGLFTTAFLRQLATPGLSVSDLFKRVRADVSAATNDLQWPAVYDGLIGDFTFHPAASGATASSLPASPVTSAGPPIAPASPPIVTPPPPASTPAPLTACRKDEVCFKAFYLPTYGNPKVSGRIVLGTIAVTAGLVSFRGPALSTGEKDNFSIGCSEITDVGRNRGMGIHVHAKSGTYNFTEASERDGTLTPRNRWGWGALGGLEAAVSKACGKAKL